MSAVKYFLNIDGIPGESSDDKHSDEIVVESWSWGITNNTAPGSGGGGAGRPTLSDFAFTARLSKASPRLALACATGEHISKAVLTAVRSGGSEFKFLTVTLNEVHVASYHTGDGGGDEVGPTDSVTLAFTQIRFEYRAMKPDGSVKETVEGGWDVKQNKPV